MSAIRFLPLLVLVAMFLGCQSDTESVAPPPEVSPEQAVRSTLERVAETGEGGSELGAIMGDIAKIKETDAEKGEALEKGVTEMMSAGKPEVVKEKAKALLETLGPGGE